MRGSGNSDDASLKSVLLHYHSACVTVSVAVTAAPTQVYSLSVYNLLQITRKQESREREAINAEDWRIVSIVIDRLIFCVSIIILFIVALWMIIMSIA